MKRSHTYNGAASSYNVDILNDFNPELQFKILNLQLEKLIYLLIKSRRFNFVTTLVIEFKIIESDDATKYVTFNSNLKAKAITNENDIDDVFESVYTTIV